MILRIVCLTYCQMVEALVQHLFYGNLPSMDELVKRAKSHERIRNVMVLYSLTSTDRFYIFLQKSQEDPDVRRMLIELHLALKWPTDPRLRQLTRILRFLPFYERTGLQLDQQNYSPTTASQQVGKLLRSLERLHRLQGRRMTAEKQRYLAERRSNVRLVKRL
jgi:hypothetical protein